MSSIDLDGVPGLASPDGLKVNCISVCNKHFLWQHRQNTV